ncbi:M48 family metallopeptidase [Rugosibacter aromaticivorans]|uniref:M48 family metallopeptidase n=1 Tax=Rugosibacter aromaticivorans TaxID=1565605 RepID=UPI001219A18A|nr:SprT family zinc-dependent metalloprotease [Rugosibacter aromaticivorans]TBR15109.1 MAG: M48 family peptidase [Rugosibacter sp.]
MLEQLKLFRLPQPAPVPKTRQVVISGRIVDFRIKTGARRLSMTIDERGLRLSAPTRMRLADIDHFVLDHGAWVLQKLDELARVCRPRHINIKDGAPLPLLGQDIEVRVIPGANRFRWIAQTLVLEARPDANLGGLATRALKAQALIHFSGRLAHYTAQIHLAPPPLGLSAARTRWGSCSRNSGIRINWRLIHLAPHLGDYVVAHEVAHLLEMNHSVHFWRIVGTLYPDWKTARNELKTCAASLPIL